MPDRTHGVNHETRRQVMAARDLRIAGGAAAERAAVREQAQPRRAMDGPVHAASAEERGVGGIDDGVDIQLGDVGADDFDGSLEVGHES